MSSRFLRYDVIICLLLVVAITIIAYYCFPQKKIISIEDGNSFTWIAPDIDQLPSTSEANMIRYGRELIINTSNYFGPKGSIMAISNGMNCQNCHLDAGTRLYGNNFSAVASTYPKYRDRSGRVETIEYRINECMQRSLNGEALDSNCKEMKAMVAYIKWLGKDVPKGIKPDDASAKTVTYLNRASDTVSGKTIYFLKCLQCHGPEGQGQAKSDSSGFFYPPLWGSHSYNVSAGIYRLSLLAAFVKSNMPYTPTHTTPQLTDEEAWDVAAFVCSQPRPEKFFSYDWGKIQTKPVDYPFGPFADTYSASQHKYGPFGEMKKPKQGSK